jgi:regulator of sigma E protease
MTLVTTIIAFVVALGALIVIHEFGHYLVARWCGVKVLRFSVGFGRALWSKRMGRDGTEWVVAAFPLGGYVKMADEREGKVAAEDVHRAFNRQSVYRRIAIVIAGPVANFLLAIALYWFLFVYGMPGLKPILGPVAPGSPAAVAGFAAGETIARIGGEPVATWQDARWLLLQQAVKRAHVAVEVRTERRETVSRMLDLSGLTPADLDSDFLRAMGLARYRPAFKPVIGNVVAGGAAESAGLKSGDEIIAIDNRDIRTWDEFVGVIRGHPGRHLNLEIKRGGRLLPAIAVMPATVTENGEPVGRIGAAPLIDHRAMADLIIDVRYGPLESVGKAFAKTWDTSMFSLKMLGKMIVGEVSLKNLSGPITIADYAGQSAQSGWISYLLFIALVSISLGVLNLLPIPLLDGGHLMYYTLEIFKGSPVSDRAIEVGQHIGIVLLFTLMAFAIYNDIIRLVSG